MSELIAGMKRRRCGDCEGCRREDCGECTKCIRKKKFGGDGRCHDTCVRRRCSNLHLPKLTTGVSSSGTPEIKNGNDATPRTSGLPEKRRRTAIAHDFPMLSCFASADEAPMSDDQVETPRAESNKRNLTKKEQNKLTWRGFSKPSLDVVKQLLAKMGVSTDGSNSAINHRFERTLSRHQLRFTDNSVSLGFDVNVLDDDDRTVMLPDPVQTPERMESKKRPAESISSPRAKPVKQSGRRRARVRCGECEACLRPDCGSCEQCAKKKKFGGDGSSKEACIYRRCKNLKERSSRTPGTRSASGRRKLDKRFYDPPPPPRKKMRPKPPKPPDREHFFGVAREPFVEKLCGNCHGERDEQLKLEPILICDGCDREFHLQCCEPTLEEIPSGDFYCLDCDKRGSTRQLELYFETHNEERAEFESSRAFVEHMLTTKTEEQGDGARIPMSELNRASRLHSDAMNDSKFEKGRKISSSGGSSARNKKLSADFLVGKPIRMYCHIGNQYHSGRIIDWRETTHCDDFWPSEFGHIEFLVRFPAGKDFRKVSFEQWIILEEHAVAVGCSLLWGMNHERRAVLGWRPGMSWLRTSVELLPVQTQLAADAHQIYYVDGPSATVRHTSWALTSFYGDDQYVLLRLADEAVNFFSKSFMQLRVQRHASTKEPYSNYDLLIGLAVAEWEEQRRIRQWQANFPLKNASHGKALALLNESELNVHEREDKEAGVTPLLACGIDRSWLMMNEGEEWQTKDTAGTMQFERLDPGPSSIEACCSTSSSGEHV